MIDNTMTSNSEYAIFSVDLTTVKPGEKRPNATDAIQRRSAVIDFMRANSIGYKCVWGCWDEQLEASFVVKASDLPAIDRNGFLDGQECVLHLGPSDSLGRRKATLQFEGRIDRDKEIGLFQAVPSVDAIANGSFTYDPMTGEYFVAK